MELEQEKKIESFYEENIFKSKKIQKIIDKKKSKGKQLKAPKKVREY
jgi:hypothetical protein